MQTTALRQAIENLVARHEALRTTFVSDANGTPRQRIAPAVTIELQEIDLSDLPPAQRESQARARGRGGPPTVRSRPGSAAAHLPAAPGPRGACAAANPAPHHRR
ncbi:MAG: hypothetical protein KZQ63_12790 [Candidatus Thiodiazotropha sp. (ex Lucinoma aequizonata)]|nr:hypothetical protein [Candidatus Thiodiazotropha sp. (ex Lucinoma aequizonata)]MCU7908802.1 hypothetical protein [Candidatus Thiodiazotropha sp. (ex Lucinoma aequizonata)]MCU7912803.1 hypothetical protein [Candidatus Thiodiazotropha sp. (ex Lucinoma aequizonata)]